MTFGRVTENTLDKLARSCTPQQWVGPPITS